MRQKPLLQTHDEDHGELQAFSLMQGDQGHGISFFIETIDIRDQGHPFQERGQAIFGLEVSIFIGYGAELKDVLPSLLIALQDVVFIPGALQHQVDKRNDV